jgi:hypothetical protein
MSYGFTAYDSFVRIHVESGEPEHPSWHALPHIGRLAWEAAAQAVAMAILPFAHSTEDEEELDEEADVPVVQEEPVKSTPPDADPPPGVPEK